MLDHRLAEAARHKADVTVQELWVDYFALGGKSTSLALRRYLIAGEELPAQEYDIVAHALNERLMDRGLDDPVPYSE